MYKLNISIYMYIYKYIYIYIHIYTYICATSGSHWANPKHMLDNYFNT